MQQAGFWKLDLYEDKDLTYLFLDADTIVNLATSGELLQFNNADEPKLNTNPIMNANYFQAFDYKIEFFIEDYNEAAIEMLQKISESIYGFRPLLYFYDARLEFLDETFFIEETSINPNDSFNFFVKMSTRQPSKKILKTYDPDTSMSEYKADTTIITADSTVITADYY